MNKNRFNFKSPSNPETSDAKKEKNKKELPELEKKSTQKWRDKKSRKLQAMEKEGNVDHYYDDDIVETISEEFTDRITALVIIGDIIRALGGLMSKRPLYFLKQLIQIIIHKIKTDEVISRKDVAEFTRVSQVSSNELIPFMNGGPAGENWIKGADGFYDWIEKSEHFIIGIELGFKADDFGLEVTKKLIEKKKSNPNFHVSILIDGFVSIFLQRPEEVLDDFQKNTLVMINNMKKAGINVRINDSWNPISSDFLAANHIKLWIFDGKVAFFGGIGIESQFRFTLYDQMDLVKGPFVSLLTLISILLLTYQKRRIADSFDKITQIYELKKDEIYKKFLPEIEKEGSVNLKLSMNVPGYIQDAQKDYVELLDRKDVHEIFIMAPYFSDDKIARALVRASERILSRMEKQKRTEIQSTNPNLSKNEINQLIQSELKKEKKIHVVFPKKQENFLIEEVSKYYAYYLRNNPIVDTRRYVAQVGDQKFNMLHAKQMVVVLKEEKDNWIKYVKFGGSHNPAGRAHNMWELNAVAYQEPWSKSDEPNSAENSIKKYMQEVMEKVVKEYSEPFPWGNVNVKISVFEKFVMKFAQLLWV